MQIIKTIGSIIERHLNENARAEVVGLNAVVDYNIMMGNIEDPSEDEEESEVENNG
ncbi:MAG: hypothetical protein IJI27_08090 [Oscillospiraceae bacterium]|nr:hypothetical protein [Oscillospiraceae bacterium]